eukprot:gene34330-biopygen9107
MAVLNNYPVNCAATWMDSVRHHAPYMYMDNWHFLNMNPKQTYKQVGSGEDVVYNLTRVRRTFEQRLALPADSVFMNLKVLFHLMGDISQPLHVGYGSRSKEEVMMILAGTPEMWMKEARVYLKNAYAFPLVPHGQSHLSQQYLDSNVAIVKQQLGRAAIRLADALEKSFGDRK